MTLDEVIKDIDRQMNTFMHVFISAEAMDLLRDHVGYISQAWIELNKQKKWVYRMHLDQAEEVRNKARIALAQQVADKLLEGTQ